MIDYTTDQLIADVKREGSVPTSQQLFVEQDFVDFMSDAMKKRIIPYILSTREEHFVTHVDYTIQDGQLEYAVPERAIGEKVRSVSIYNAAGRKITELSEVDPQMSERVEDDPRLGGSTVYHFEGGNIVISEDLTSDAVTLRVKYYRRPSKLALVINAGQVTAVDKNTGSITMSNLPNGLAAGVNVDIQSGRPGFQTRADSVPVLTQIAFSIGVDASLIQDVEVGDWVCFEGESVIPQIPYDLHPILSQYVVAKVLRSLGDTQGAADAAADLKELEDSLYEYLEDRDDGSDNKVISPNGLWDNTDDYGDF